MSFYFDEQSPWRPTTDSPLKDVTIPNYSNRQTLLDCLLVPQYQIDEREKIPRQEKPSVTNHTKKDRNKGKGREKGNNHIGIQNSGEDGMLTLEACLSQVKEIEEELILYRNTIYTEKLQALQDELISIEKETHKKIRREDRMASKKKNKELARIEAMYQYELGAVDNQAEYEKSQILEDTNRKLIFAQQVLKAESNPIVSDPPRKKLKLDTKERDSSSLSCSETEDRVETDDSTEHKPIFKKIYLKKKIGKLEAIYDRHKAANINKNQSNPQSSLEWICEEVDNDLQQIKEVSSYSVSYIQAIYKISIYLRIYTVLHIEYYCGYYYAK
ncbi:MAG: hypothetical protein EXX96DRAFT_549857 [Benjaminiella poitrasii]|nr:MAG: hypothetical protein EXX96DRAFT_549857 [Benjaminiella poitrasii]